MRAAFPARWVYAGFALLCTTNALTLVAFLMSPDIARLSSDRNAEVLSAYENRLAELRLEVDRLHSRHYAQVGDTNLRLREVARAQRHLTEQHQQVRAIVESAADLGLLDLSSDQIPPKAPAPPLAPSDVASAELALARMIEETRSAFGHVATIAETRTTRIWDELGRVGIGPDDSQATSGTGGPLLPLRSGAGEPDFLAQADFARAALEDFRAAQQAAISAPIHRPTATSGLPSSGYGNRADPFTGRPAFHSGIDYPFAIGTKVLSAGAGLVSFVGTRPGYGKVVDVDHGRGLVTRYAHLSAFLVREGQTVTAGTQIAEIGSTGRSTGPHLHFEVQRDGTPVDPGTFLSVGKRLEQLSRSR